jgi:hypothetical protein
MAVNEILRNVGIIRFETNELTGEQRSSFPEGGVGLVPKRGCLLTLAYYAFPR